MLSEDARAEAERRYPKYPSGEVAYDIDANRHSKHKAFVAGAEWQASRPFTKEDVEAAARGLFKATFPDSGAWDSPDDFGKSEWLRKARAALDAVTARHTKGDGA